MTYDLFIGDRTFSSWSLRGWLMLEKFNLAYRVHPVGLYTGTMAQDMAALAPARLVPVLRTPEGTVVAETLAMAETLAERHPGVDLWPRDAAARATARWLCAAMTSGFTALRSNCPMQLLHVIEDFQPSAAVQTDITQIEALWQHATRMRAEDGPWLFGRYSLADVFFAPVAARMVGYDLPVSDWAQAYCATTISDPAFQTWRAEGLKVTYDRVPYDLGTKRRPWPAPRT